MEAEDSITRSFITQPGVQVSPQHSVVHAAQQSAVHSTNCWGSTSLLLPLSHPHGFKGMFLAVLVEEHLVTKKR